MLIKLPIDRFDVMAESTPLPVYVVVCGGIAVGKTHVIRKHLKNFVIADIDDYMTRHGFTNYDRQGPEFRQCMDEIALDINQYKQDRKNIVAMGTGANFGFLHYRLVEAHIYRYRTALIHVTCPSLEQAIAQNAERLAKNEHAVAPDQLDVIHQTIEASATNVARLRTEFPYLVDFICEHQNLRGPDPES
jgi:hypothetical protein